MQAQPTGAAGAGEGRGVNGRLILAIIAVIVALIFIFQNTHKVNITFLFFTVETATWVGFLVSLVLGALIGQAFVSLRRRRRERRSQQQAG
jgi:uncharacterized integral membrane protein